LISLEHHVWYEPQPHEPPSADPHARWCGRGAVMLTAPYADVGRSIQGRYFFHNRPSNKNTAMEDYLNI